MKYPVRTEAHFTVVSLTGEVDLYYSPDARKQILRYLNDKQHVLIDLSEVQYIDSSGVASLVEGYQLAKSKGLEFGLVGVSQAAMQVLELARLDQVFPIHATVADRLNGAP
ncbi:MAG: STAS domain-containing protein [Gammaproteobacteria bacterium]